MPWNPVSDGDSAETLRQFALGLNNVLSSTSAVEKYAFAGDMAYRFLASATQGQDGVYHTHIPPPPTPHRVLWPHPTAVNPNGAVIDALVLECKIQLRDPTEGGCAALESDLERIVPLSRRDEDDYSQWHHTRLNSIYGWVLPGTSTYRFHRSFGLWHAFHIVWNTTSYPPWTSTHLPYPANAYVKWKTTIPLFVMGEAEGKSPDMIFLRNVLEESKSKGKGRVQ
ncbi:hypothetical protein C8R45DRAFT_478953 [Mycena sanguinolenta]|nr:hypothetical protein C8R45DRAFT_478953 [Mycena sanguinolenta]